MESSTLCMIAFIFYLAYKIIQLQHKSAMFKAKLQMRLRKNNLKGESSASKKRNKVSAKNNCDDESEEEKQILEELDELNDYHDKNYNKIVELLKEKTTKQEPAVHYHVGPSNNNNVNLNFQLNVLPTIGSSPLEGLVGLGARRKLCL